MLVVGQPDNTRIAMRRAHVVRNIEAFDAQHTLAASSQLIAGRATHRAHTDNNHIKAITACGALPRHHCREPLARSRTPPGSKNGVGVTVAGINRPLVETSTRLPGQPWVVRR